MERLIINPTEIYKIQVYKPELCTFKYYKAIPRIKILGITLRHERPAGWSWSKSGNRRTIEELLNDNYVRDDETFILTKKPYIRIYNKFDGGYNDIYFSTLETIDNYIEDLINEFKLPLAIIRER